MTQQTIIRKASGEKEPFSFDKLENSLKRAGAKEKTINSIKISIEKLLYDGITTQKIYKKAFELLRKERRSMAARYSLKHGIMQLGPTGYPFEHFVAQVLAAQGYKTKTGQILQGHCVTHEIDVIATQNNRQYLIECKYFNSQGKHCSVQVPLYIHSRVNDIIKKREQIRKFEDYNFEGWIVTNTRFTKDATDYGKCAGLHLVSWDYPQKNSLKAMIEKHNIFPVTILTHLTKKDKEYLLEKGIVLCRQLQKTPEILNALSLKEKTKQNILNEVDDLVVMDD